MESPRICWRSGMQLPYANNRWVNKGSFQTLTSCCRLIDRKHHPKQELLAEAVSQWSDGSCCLNLNHVLLHQISRKIKKWMSQSTWRWGAETKTEESEGKSSGLLMMKSFLWGDRATFLQETQTNQVWQASTNAHFSCCCVRKLNLIDEDLCSSPMICDLM